MWWWWSAAPLASLTCISVLEPLYTLFLRGTVNLCNVDEWFAKDAELMRCFENWSGAADVTHRIEHSRQTFHITSILPLRFPVFLAANQISTWLCINNKILSVVYISIYRDIGSIDQMPPWPPVSRCKFTTLITLNFQRCFEVSTPSKDMILYPYKALEGTAWLYYVLGSLGTKGCRLHSTGIAWFDWVPESMRGGQARADDPSSIGISQL